MKQIINLRFASVKLLAVPNSSFLQSLFLLKNDISNKYLYLINFHIFINYIKCQKILHEHTYAYASIYFLAYTYIFYGYIPYFPK